MNKDFWALRLLTARNFKILGVGILALIAGKVVSWPVYVYGTRGEETATITDVQRVVAKDGKSAKYLIFTDNGTLENTDEWLLMKWNSSDVQGRAAACLNKKATVTKFGWRLPVLSQYPNAINVVCK